MNEPKKEIALKLLNDLERNPIMQELSQKKNIILKN
jgi:hypothetical protein